MQEDTEEAWRTKPTVRERMLSVCVPAGTLKVHWIVPLMPCLNVPYIVPLMKR